MDNMNTVLTDKNQADYISFNPCAANMKEESSKSGTV